MAACLLLEKGWDLELVFYLLRGDRLGVQWLGFLFFVVVAFGFFLFVCFLFLSSKKCYSARLEE